MRRGLILMLVVGVLSLVSTTSTDGSNWRPIPDKRLGGSYQIGGSSTVQNRASSIVGDLRIDSIASNVFGHARTIRVWLPPGYDDAANRNNRYPVLYLNDGQNLFDAATNVFRRAEWRVDEIATDLIDRKRIIPLIIVGLDHGGTADARTREYLPYEDPTLKPPLSSPDGKKYPEFLMHEVIPFVDSRYRTDAKPESRGLGGSSFGAIISLYTAIERPGMIGRLLLESPTLYVADRRLLKDSASSRTWPSKVYLAIGASESARDGANKEAVELVKRLEQVLGAAGLGTERLKVTIDENGRHDAESWSRRLPAALEFLFGT